MRIIHVCLSAVLITSGGLAGGWRFVGPDSSHWRRVVQMDVSFEQGRAPRIGIGTSQGVCVRMSDDWRYVLADHHSFSPPEEIMYRAVYFSPWSDSVAFVGSNLVYVGEPGSIGGQVSNIYSPLWGIPWSFGGGYIGHNPSLSFEFSPHHPGWVYSWIINLYKSSNNGTSWNLQPVYDCYGALFLSGDMDRDSVLYAGRRRFGESFYGIHRSTDDGTSWSFVFPLSVPAYTPFQRTADFLAKGDTLVLATNRFPYGVDSTCGITVSTDGGITWSGVLSTVNVQKLSRDQLNASEVYAATQSGIYRSLNGGISWELLADSLPSLNLVDIRKDPYSDTLYVATSDSGVFQVFGIAVGVGELTGAPGNQKLLQNYPNPFNPTTTIAYELSQTSEIVLSVFDLLGRQIVVLASGVYGPGKHQVVFDGSRLGSGVYFARLQTSAGVRTNSIMLLK